MTNDLIGLPTNIPDELADCHYAQSQYFYSFVTQINDLLDKDFEACVGTGCFYLSKVLSQIGDKQVIKYSAKIDRNESINMERDEFEQKIIELAYSQNNWVTGASFIVNI